MKNLTLTSFALRRALGKFATGVTIVTTADDRCAPVGVTANSFSSTSLDPPLVLWSLAKASRSWPAFQAARHFGIHILTAEQVGLAQLFATSGAEKFAGLELERGPDQIPLLHEFAVRLVCRKVSDIDAGDHGILLGEVLALESRECSATLVFHEGRFAKALPLQLS